MNVFVAGLSYKTAPVEVRETAGSAPVPSDLLRLPAQLNAELDEVVLLSTCNRVEIYGATASWVQGKVHRLSAQLLPGGLDLDPLHLRQGRHRSGRTFVLGDERFGFDGHRRNGDHRQVKTPISRRNQAGLTGAAF